MLHINNISEAKAHPNYQSIAMIVTKNFKSADAETVKRYKVITASEIFPKNTAVVMYRPSALATHAMSAGERAGAYMDEVRIVGTKQDPILLINLDLMDYLFDSLLPFEVAPYAISRMHAERHWLKINKLDSIRLHAADRYNQQNDKTKLSVASTFCGVYSTLVGANMSSQIEKLTRLKDNYIAKNLHIIHAFISVDFTGTCKVILPQSKSEVAY